MSSKTISELSNHSAALSAFDLPLYEGDANVAMREMTRVPFRPANSNGAAALALVAPAERAFLELVASRPGDLPALQDLASHPLGGPLKRAFDIIVASTAIVLTAPLILTLALLVYATMGRPIFYSQRRVGFGGAPFQCLKFRTMVTDAEVVLRAYLNDNPVAASEWQARQKLTHDPRITRLGRLLRQTSLDELPQFVNILKGDMSCVGPRPIVEAEIVRYGRYWKEYLRTRPGLTGTWQVSGRNRLNYKKRVALDRSYVRRWSFWRDLVIIALTIPAVTRFDDTA